MRYGQIRKLDVANGEGIRTSFFVTGCNNNCKNCFNTEYKDFEFGKLWTEKETNQIIENLDKEEIAGLSILGGEPFEHIDDLIDILNKIKSSSKKDIWIWSGFTFEELIKKHKAKNLLGLCDVLVDGRYVEEERDLTLKFRGSRNQRVLDLKKSLKKNIPVEKEGYILYNENKKEMMK